MLEKIKRIVNENPSKLAYTVNEKSINYDELWTLSSNYAKLLSKEGNSPVIIYGSKDIDVIISILSCIIANRTYIPLGLCTPVFRIKKIIEMTNASLILTNENLEIDDIHCCKLDDLKQFDNDEEKSSNNDIVYIIFTSGSTGTPKGVPISKENLSNFIEWISNLDPLSKYKNVNVLNQASFSFDLSVADLYYSLCNGHTLNAFDSGCQENFNGLYSLFSKAKINVAVMTPTFMKLCLLNNDFNESNYPDFMCVYFCGEQLEVKTVEKIWSKFPNIKIINAYGPTEATSAVSAINIEKDMLNEDILPVGKVGNFAVDIKIEDEEIVLRGKSVFNGYLGNISGGYFKENDINCYKTGDIGYFKDDKLYCKGRIDNQVKFKGYRIELNDIENNINKIFGIKEACVLAKYDERNIVKTIKAFVVVDNENIDSNYIKEKLSTLIPEYMIPKTVKIIDKLPINQNGKIDRKALMNL